MPRKTKLAEDEVIQLFPSSPMSHCYWDHELKTFWLERGFSSTTMTLDREDAKSLRDILTRFLKETE